MIYSIDSYKTRGNVSHGPYSLGSYLLPDIGDELVDVLTTNNLAFKYRHVGLV